ncbi:hypothetical protein ACROYT_G024336 [Oculina patagonica]
MTVIEKIESFDETQEIWETYVERVEEVFLANNIDEDRQVSTMLGFMIGSKTYTLLRDLVTPDKPATKSSQEIFTALQKHFIPVGLAVVAMLAKRVLGGSECTFNIVRDRENEYYNLREDN